MCDKAILENGGTLKSVPDCYKSQQMCDKAADNYHHALKFVPNCYMTHFMIKLSILILLQWNMFLIDLRLQKRVIEPLIDVFLYLILFLISINLK